MTDQRNPYVTEKQYVGSVQELKDAQKKSPMDANYYYPTSNQTPYSLMKVNNATVQMTNQSQMQPNAGYPSVYTNTAPPHNYNIQYGNKVNVPPPPPPQNKAPIIVQVQSNITTGPCAFCHQNAGVMQKKRCGCAMWSWSCGLLWLTGVCCWIPWVMKDCYDIQYVCTSCGQVRAIVRSRYCV